MQRTANENAACLRRICKRSEQSKIERTANNDARLILRRSLRELIVVANVNDFGYVALFVKLKS